METWLVIAIGVVAIALIIKFLGGLIRIILGVVIVLIAAYLVYQFIL